LRRQSPTPTQAPVASEQRLASYPMEHPANSNNFCGNQRRMEAEPGRAPAHRLCCTAQPEAISTGETSA
jgi:hypothetical protein